MERTMMPNESTPWRRDHTYRVQPLPFEPHRLDGLSVDRTPGKGTVQVDNMEPFKALILKRARLRCRIVVEHRLARHVALDEAHTTPVLQVDRRKQDHGRHSKKFSIRRRPTAWLFSG